MAIPATDWDTFFAKCATETGYREDMANALQNNNDAAVIQLLKDAKVAEPDLAKRLQALKSTYRPMLELARAFGAPSDFVAP